MPPFIRPLSAFSPSFFRRDSSERTHGPRPTAALLYRRPCYCAPKPKARILENSFRLNNQGTTAEVSAHVFRKPLVTDENIQTSLVTFSAPESGAFDMDLGLEPVPGVGVGGGASVQRREPYEFVDDLSKFCAIILEALESLFSEAKGKKFSGDIHFLAVREPHITRVDWAPHIHTLVHASTRTRIWHKLEERLQAAGVFCDVRVCGDNIDSRKYITEYLIVPNARKFVVDR